MAALNRPTNATYQTHENMTVDTQDNEDHTFCGIMFPIKCRDLLPIDHLIIKSVAVRGNLGPLTVWVSNKNAPVPYNSGPRREEHKIPLAPKYWTKLYGGTHEPCAYGNYTELVFDKPLRMEQGEMRALYVHSTLEDDSAIVYDNSYNGMPYKRFEDDTISIRTGRAHVSPTCFGQNPIWGWGNAWRDKREFVGTMDYGTVYKLWNPEVQPKFGKKFRTGAETMMMCQRRWESPVSLLPDEAVFYILNMCRWDWFGDDSDTMKDRRKREKASNTKQQCLLEQQLEESREGKKRPVRETEKNSKRRVFKARLEQEAQETVGSDQASSARGCSRCSAGASAGDNTAIANGGKEEEEDEDEEYSDSDSDSDRKYAAVEWDDDSDDGEKISAIREEVQVKEVQVKETQMEDSDYDEEEDEEEDDDDDSEAWDEAPDQYRSATRDYFQFQDLDSDDEGEPAAPRFYRERQQTTANWLRHHFARAHILRALASMEDHAIAGDT